ncbi:MAG TPA: DUF5676 family membrane protein [Patescibacteria group bacterium]|jgi:hypothetical protein|nr:DUF5676 family membrane protein [Patescibacteria group bacterium]
MFHKRAFAKALATLTGITYIVLAVLQIVLPGLFKFLFNAQFFGADVAGNMPEFSFGYFVETLIAMVVVSWIIGYVWAWLYNRFSR